MSLPDFIFTVQIILALSWNLAQQNFPVDSPGMVVLKAYRSYYVTPVQIREDAFA